MASTAERLQEPDLLRTYLRALNRQGGTPDRRLQDGRQIRTCPKCGARALFRPEDTWYRCTACGQFA